MQADACCAAEQGGETMRQYFVIATAVALLLSGTGQLAEAASPAAAGAA